MKHQAANSEENDCEQGETYQDHMREGLIDVACILVVVFSVKRNIGLENCIDYLLAFAVVVHFSASDCIVIAETEKEDRSQNSHAQMHDLLASS